MKFFLFISLSVFAISGCSFLGSEQYQSSCKEVYDVAEQMPILIGGTQQLQEKANYPIQGRVRIDFVVNKNGNPIQLQIREKLHPGADREALRVVREAKFQPALEKNIPVCVRYALPINFSQ